MVRSKPADIVLLPTLPSAAPGFRDAVVDALADRRSILTAALDRMRERPGPLPEVAALLVERLRSGRQVMVAGNGGSAAEAQHFATELVGRFRRERDAYPVLALTADTSILTAVANDYGFEEVFARQVQAFGRPGDVFVAFSTSGESNNLIRAADAARERGVDVVAVTGARPNRLARRARYGVRVPSTDVPVIQELHQIVIHLLCDLVEAALVDAPRSRPASGVRP